MCLVATSSPDTHGAQDWEMVHWFMASVVARWLPGASWARRVQHSCFRHACTRA